ncbi:hypothetical protein E2C01_037928 [Portunus trituberculatus]|uniref:Uncharacterized protein n=1 Tax=Portunus trituberculatus TaxID=210409 RepID=A0A5B7FG94_PORTR|nr:hypothetical protein [Portunus trituberculatus]
MIKTQHIPYGNFVQLDTAGRECGVTFTQGLALPIAACSFKLPVTSSPWRQKQQSFSVND